MIRRYFDDHPTLVLAGVFLMVLFAVLGVAMIFDQTQILGINRWIKPMKFFVSVAILLWTIAVFFYHLPGRERMKRFVTWSMIVIFFVELIAVLMQALRGVKSHFNISTPFDGAVYGLMGIAIAGNTLLVAYLLFVYLKSDIPLPAPIVFGMRLGLLVFQLGSVQGGFMSSQAGHAVGAPDGGPGLPVVNWSTAAGDLRVAHFVGLHALQAIPIVALVLNSLRVRKASLLTGVFALAYFALFSILFAQALRGFPIWHS